MLKPWMVLVAGAAGVFFLWRYFRDGGGGDKKSVRSTVDGKLYPRAPTTYAEYSPEVKAELNKIFPAPALPPPPPPPVHTDTVTGVMVAGPPPPPPRILSHW